MNLFQPCVTCGKRDEGSAFFYLCMYCYKSVCPGCVHKVKHRNHKWGDLCLCGDCVGLAMNTWNNNYDPWFDDLDEEEEMSSGCGGNCNKSCAGKPQCEKKKCENPDCKCDGKCEDCKCGEKKCSCDMDMIMTSGCQCGGK